MAEPEASLIDRIASYDSVAIVGLAKNAGKTECLNYILRGLHDRGLTPAVTSIGVDGEQTDAVSHTRKPEITLFEETVFVTSESFYRSRGVTSEVLGIGTRATALGRLVTARVKTHGKVILAGPPDTASLRRLISDLRAYHADVTLVDGALSRMSSASPAVTDALVLATGAAIAPSIPEITRRTAFVCEVMRLPALPPEMARRLEDVERGVVAVDAHGGIQDLGLPSAIALGSAAADIPTDTALLYVAGAVTDRLLATLRQLPQADGMALAMRDFSCMFASREAFTAFTSKGGAIFVARPCRVLAICVNPTSPAGYRVDSRRLCDSIKEKTGIDTIDVRLNRNLP